MTTVKIKATQEVEVKVSLDDCLNVVCDQPAKVPTTRITNLLSKQFKIMNLVQSNWYYNYTEESWYKTVEGYSGGHYDEPDREELQRSATEEEITFYNALRCIEVAV